MNCVGNCQVTANIKIDLMNAYFNWILSSVNNDSMNKMMDFLFPKDVRGSDIAYLLDKLFNNIG